MKYGENMKSDRKTSYLKAILINMAVLAAFLIVYYPVFETNDDMAMANFVNGIAGFSDPHLVFQSSILGRLYVLLYGITARLPWYGMFQYGVIFAAFTSITYVLGNRLSKGNARVILAVILFVAGFESYANMQFTRTAAIAAAAGLLILLYSVEEQRKGYGIFDALMGLALIAVGSMLRYYAFLSVTALMTGLGVYRLWQFVHKEKDPVTGKVYPLAKAFTLVLIALTVCVTLRTVDKAAYSGSEWEYYDRFNDARSNLVDYGIPSYSANKKALKELGITKNDLQMIRSVNILDPEVFTADKLEALVALKAPAKSNKSTSQWIRGFLDDLYRYKIRSLLFVFLACLILMCIISMTRSKMGTLVTVVYEVLALLALFIGLYAQGRSTLTRVNFGPVLAAALVVAMLCQKDAWKQMLLIAILGIVVVKAAGLREEYPQPFTRMSAQEILETDKRSKAECLNAIGSDKEHIYLAAVGSVSDTAGFSVLDRVPQGMTDNIIYLGGWETEMVLTNRRMEENGVNIPLLDVINSDKIRLVCIEGQLDMFLTFIRQHHNKEAEAVKIGDVGYAGIYQVTAPVQ